MWPIGASTSEHLKLSELRLSNLSAHSPSRTMICMIVETDLPFCNDTVCWNSVEAVRSIFGSVVIPGRSLGPTSLPEKSPWSKLPRKVRLLGRPFEIKGASRLYKKTHKIPASDQDGQKNDIVAYRRPKRWPERSFSEVCWTSFGEAVKHV